MHINGVNSEKFFKNFCNDNNLVNKCVHKPFDFIVEDKNVEVKSCKLFVKNGVNNKLCHGRYECWNKKQLDNIIKNNVWICFIIQINKEFIIQGFVKGKNFKHSKNRCGIFELEKNYKLLTKNQFINYIKNKKEIK